MVVVPIVHMGWSVMETKKFDLLDDIEWDDFYQKPVLTLIVTNLLVLLWALYQQWGVLSVMWIYWIQSVSIGFFWFLTILFHRNLYQGANFFNRSSEPERLRLFSRMSIACFFLFNYGFFHFVYLSFFLSKHFFSKNPAEISTKSLLLFGGLFVLSQLFSFVQEFGEITNKPASVKRFMTFPYVRIVPFHMTIIFGGFFGTALNEFGFSGGPLVLLIFLLLKTSADAVMEIKQRKGFLDPAEVKLGPLSLPAILQTEKGDVLALADGRIVELAGNPELEARVGAILKFPPDMQTEVMEKIVKKYSDPPPAPTAPVICRCNEFGRLTGPEARRYAEEHLLFIQTCDDGTGAEYRCPQTHKRWVLFNNTLTKVEIRH